ncbi:OmpP1/FadL family transporter [Anaeromyxobacter sp. Fw109-5]|uniref:OmpP1/FadL family transporter n=1 Tax=Anaeromyxobacter sp. (strain Fw109-5) TaxID=404589 RepID=UPI0000ED6CDB|nr:outer membrane protein transport protein [Anaeromyxobacter sp. Fw109-5]ABS28289.1 membrane protein involved in aromatic hydrocarbon degradation [Anaeromyxobacter sp. Fw109-5]
MTTNRIASLLAALSLLAPAAAHATNGMRMIGFSPVQDAMGGVGVGATLDAASLLTNPAGMADLGRRLELGGSYFKPSVSYSASGSGPMPQMFVANDGASLDSDRGASPIPLLAYVQPVTDRLTTGIGVFGVAGMGVDYGMNLYNGPTLTSYMQGRFTPAAAYRVSDRLSLGVTANLMVAQMEYDVASGAGQAAHDTATSFGAGATFGVKYSPVKRVSFGAAYETRSWFQDFSFTVPERPNPMTGGTNPAGTDELAFDQPQSATLGVAVTPVDALLLAVDVQWIDWSSTMGDGLPQYSSDPMATGAMPFDMGWSDQWVVKVGTQVMATPKLALRAGYNYGKMPLDPDRAFENMAFPAVSEHHVTAGAGYVFSDRLSANVAGVYALNASIEGANPAEQGISSYSTEMSQLAVDVALCYRF